MKPIAPILGRSVLGLSLLAATGGTAAAGGFAIAEQTITAASMP